MSAKLLYLSKVQCGNVVGWMTHLLALPFQLSSDDIKRRRKFYTSDWTDAFKKKGQVIPAIFFLYFACLSPAVSFGTIANQITNGSIGIVEFLLSSGLSGMVSEFLVVRIALYFWHTLTSTCINFTLGVCCHVWSTHGLHCAHRINIGVYLCTLPLLYPQGLALLPRLYLGRSVDIVLHALVGIQWILQIHQVLHTLYRRSL